MSSREPIFLEPVFQEKIWGGDRLRTSFGYDIPSGHTGECWAISGHPGGDCRIKGRPGQTLGGLWREERALFGGLAGEGFPLLVKLLDAREDLSIQVHPDDSYARLHENGASGKTECWYILDCDPDATIIIGHHARSPRELREMVEGKRWGELLREVPEADFRSAIPALRRECGDRAVLRALHFYDDDRRAVQEADALERGDFAGFLALVNASGASSSLHLQNTWSTADPRQQAIPLALAFGRELLEGTGSIRVHGGGFAGTIQAFVPLEKLDAFRSGMEALLGPGMCHVLRIRPQGGCVVAS